MAKKKIFYSIILLFAVISICSLSVSPVKTSFEVADEQSEININILSTPKSSAVSVSEKWRHKCNSQPNTVAISRDGSHIMGLNTTSAVLFHRDANTTKWTFPSPSGTPMNDVAMSNDGKYIVVEDTRQIFLLNNTPSAPKLSMWEYPSIPAAQSYFVDISGDGTKIAMANETGILLFDNVGAGTKQWLFSWRNPESIPIMEDIAISGDGNYIIAGAQEDYIYLFNTTDPQGTYMWKYNTTSLVDDVEISYDGKYFVASNDENEVYFFNRTNNQGNLMWNFTLGNNIRCLELSENGIYVVLGSHIWVGMKNCGKVYILDKSFSSNKVPLRIENHTLESSNFQHYVQSVAISRDGSYIIAGYDSPPATPYSSIVLFDKNGKIWENLNYSNFDASSVAISGDGSYIAVTEWESGRNNIHLFYHHVPLPPGIIPGAGDDDDDDDDEAIIPGYEIYIIIGTISITTVILIRKRLKKK